MSPFIQLSKINVAIAIYRREQDVVKLKRQISLTLDLAVEQLNDSEYNEYVRITGDFDHKRKQSEG